MDVGEGDLGTSRRLGVGEELRLRLPETPTTGYRWQVSCAGSGALELLNDAFVPGSAAALPGAAGERVLRYVARQPGTVTISAVLQRPWEPPAPSARALTLFIG